jgi:hypothetical protein
MALRVSDRFLHAQKPSFHQLFYHAYTLFLFISSDLKTIVIPSTIFGLSNALAISHYDASVPPIKLS